MLRSKYAEPSARTYVELEAAYGDKTYRVKRTPAYERPGAAGRRRRQGDCQARNSPAPAWPSR